MEDWHLRFGITSNCNFRCSYCNSHNSVSKDMSDKDICEKVFGVRWLCIILNYN